MENLIHLSSHPLFLNMDMEAFSQKIKSQGIAPKDFAPGEEIYSPKDEQKKLGFMLFGSASVFSADENNNVLLRILEKGDTFGVANLFSDQARFVSQIVAKKACRVLFLSQEFVEQLLREDPNFHMNYIHFLSDRICFLNSKISCFTAGTPDRKLALFLLSQAPSNIEQYSLVINANSLSDMLNVGRASLYRAFDKLIAEGLIEKKGKQITIIDKNALRSHYC